MVFLSFMVSAHAEKPRRPPALNTADTVAMIPAKLARPIHFTMAFSCEMSDDYTIADEFMYDITKDLMELPIASNALWNINFPGCSLEEYKGVLRNTKIAATQLYQDHYVKEELPDGNYILKPQGIPVTTGEEGTDIHAVMNGYISIGIVKSAIIEK